MPSPTDIVTGLAEIANAAIWIAFAWHLVLAAALLAFLRGWRPHQRSAAALLVIPIASVSALAIVFGMWFNAAVFAALAITLLAFARRMPRSPIPRAADWEITVGHALIGFGLLYPHFLDSYSPLVYVVAAPFGVLPCPTLAVVIGFTLVAGGFSRAWNLTLVLVAVFYGTIGMAQLGVWIDIGVLLGGLALAWAAADLMYRRQAYT